jgi:lipid A 3-O-deacylase
MLRKLLPFFLTTLLCAETPSYLTFAAGLYDFHRDCRTAQLQIEYRYKPRFKIPAPLLGITANHQGAYYIFAGFVFDLYFSDSIILTPAFAAGYYNKGGGKDLGYPLEFRSALELSYMFKNKARLGIQTYHISNASLGHKNPGEESLLIIYGLPMY